MTRLTAARQLVIVAVLGVVAGGLLTQLNARTALYRTPFAAPLPWGPAGEKLSDRVVLCLVDGLRADTSRTLGPLNDLRRRGGDWELSVSPPTFSIPLSHVIATGAPQLTIGMLNNTAGRLIDVGFYRTFGNIYTAAQAAGLRTGNVVTWRPGYPLEQILDAPNTLPGAPGYADDDALVSRVRTVLAAPDAPQLLWVHFDIVDRAGHVAGGASDAYRAAADRTAGRIVEIAEAMDLSRETLIVTADHGHLDTGGHGGGEPEVTTVPGVFVGAGIRPLTAGTGEQLDLAATVAWLLGTPIPTHSEGWPLTGALAVEPPARARRGRDTVAQRLRAYRFRLEQLGIEDPKLDAPPPEGLRLDLIDALLAAEQWDDAWAAASNLAMELHFRWRQHLAEARTRHFLPRLYAAVGSGALVVLLSALLRRRAKRAGAPPAKNPPVWLVASILTGVAVPVLLYVGAGHGYSLSAVGRAGLAPFALRRFGEGVAGVAAAYAVARVLLRRDGATVTPRSRVLAAVCGGLAGVATGVVAVYVIGFGLTPQPWHDRGNADAILLVSLLQYIGVAAIALVAAIAVAAWDARRPDSAADASP